MALTLLVVIVAAVALFFLLRVVRAYLLFRGVRAITCPETKARAAVEVNAWRAAASAAMLRQGFRLQDCSRWPERANCGQECLAQVEEAPEDCLLRNILESWYRGQSCAYCGKPFQHIAWLDNPPALLTPERKTIEWAQFPPESVDEVLKTHRPVCFGCHVAETFRREHPELVTDRNRRPASREAGQPVGVGARTKGRNT